MKVTNVWANCCAKFNVVPSRIILALIVLFQSAVFDYILITYKGDNHYAWIAADVVVLLTFIVTFVVHIQLQKHKEFYRKGKWGWIVDYPLGHVAWFVYSIFVVIRAAVIYKDIAPTMANDADGFFQTPNMLKVNVGLTAVVFMIEVLTYYQPGITDDRKHFITILAATVSVDILDTVDHLDVLIDKEARDLLDDTAENAILGLSCINIMLPFMPLLILSQSHGHKGKRISSAARIIRVILSLFVINISFLVIRLVLWHGYQRAISVFVLKNVMMSFLLGKELYDSIREAMEAAEEDEGDGGTVDASTNTDDWRPSSARAVSQISLTTSV